MFKRPGFRFSLLNLLLILTLAAVTVSHWRTNRELAAVRRDFAAAKRSLAVQGDLIRHRNDELGKLTIGDPTQVHVISASEIWKEGYFENARPPHELSWRIHLPDGTRWKAWWATVDIPAEGLPEGRRGGLDLHGDGTQVFLSVQFVNTPVTKWDLIVSEGGVGSEFAPLTATESRWLTDKAQVLWEGPGGDQHQAPTTEAFPPNRPIVVQRIRRAIERGDSIVESDPNPAEGFMIWIEPVCEESSIAGY